MDSDDGELAFQDFSHSRGAGRDSLGDLSPPIGADGDAASFGGGHVTLDDEPLDAAPNVGANGAIGDQQYSIFNVRYYARFFNVDTPDVSRVSWKPLQPAALFLVFRFLLFAIVHVCVYVCACVCTCLLRFGQTNLNNNNVILSTNCQQKSFCFALFSI